MKTLAESLFDKDLVSKNITFGDMYDLEVVYMQNPYAFNGLYDKRLISKYSEYANKGGLNKYWSYYGNNPNWRNIPENIEKICSVFIGIIDNFNMSEVNNTHIEKYYNPFMNGTSDSLAGSLRETLFGVLHQYTKSTNSYNVYINTDYKYKGEEKYIQIKLGKTNLKKGFPDYLELIYKKK